MTALGAEAINPKRDIRRGVLLSLAIQGLLAYVFEYVAANFFIGDQLTGKAADGSAVSGYDAVAASSAPLGDMMKVIGDQMLGTPARRWRSFWPLTVILALIGTTLACLNTGCARQLRDGPGQGAAVDSGRAPRPDTRRRTGASGCWSSFRRIFGAYGALNVDNLTKITLASNYRHLPRLWPDQPQSRWWPSRAGRAPTCSSTPSCRCSDLAANLLMLAAVLYLGIHGGGASATDAKIALGIVLVWLIAGIIWLVANSASSRQPILARQ